MGIQTPLPLLEGRALSYGTDLELLPRAVAELLTSSTSNRRAACLPELRSTGTLQPRLSKSTTVLLLGLERRDVRTVECCRSSQPWEPPLTAPLRIERGRIAGESRSFISEDIADVVGQPHQFREIRTQINLADTSRVKVRRLLLADVTLARKSIQVPLPGHRTRHQRNLG